MTGRRVTSRRGTGLSLGRFWAVLVKEFIQMRRDRLTFAMMVGIPVLQLMLFGFAINTDPKHLPTAVLDLDGTQLSRTLVAAVGNTGYFGFDRRPASEAEAAGLLRAGAVQFVLTIPPGFARGIYRGEQPAILVEADATDPAATGNGLAALTAINLTALARDLAGVVADPLSPPFEIRVQKLYNPEGLSRLNIVPGLIGTILTMTMVVITAVAMTRERERGTMEGLLATPVRPLEVMIGKILPFVLVGYVQVAVVLVVGGLVFGVPVEGSLALLSGAVVVFIAANLAVGFTFSTLARTQLQASQMAIFFFLPSMLLSGFLFPFGGMPVWAQWLGETLPLTHFLRIVRGILLKGSGAAEVLPELWPIALFAVIAGAVAIRRSRETLD